MSQLAPLAAVEYGEGVFRVPHLEDLFEWPAYWFSQDWAIGPIELGVNRVVLLTFFAVVVISVVMYLTAARSRVVPGRFQSAVESVMTFVRDQIAVDAIGKHGPVFAPFLTTLFLFVLVNNFLKITPGVQFPTTGRMALPAFLAILSWCVFIGVGMRQHGPLTYLKDALFPSGVPAALYIIVSPIELVSTFVVRPLTLAIRLFANMLAGHIILALVFTATHAFLAIEAGGLAAIGVATFLVGPLVVGFELMVVVLQAYIFTILTAVYIGGALNPEH